MCFPGNFVKFLRTPFLRNTSRLLLLFFIDAWYHWVTRFQNSVSGPFENLEFSFGCNNRRRIWRRWKSGANFSFQSYWNYIFFWGVDFRVHLLLMILLTNFLYLAIYLTFPFLGVVPRVSVLLASASGWLFWEYLADWCYIPWTHALYGQLILQCALREVSKCGVFSVGIPENMDEKK